MGHLGQSGPVLQQTVEVGLLDVYAGGLVIHQTSEVGAAVLHRGHYHLGARAEAVGFNGGDDVGVSGAGHHGFCPLPVPAHGNALRRGGGPVIHRGVGCVHAGELADHGLELEDGLQHALADLRLIGGVGGDKLLLGGDAAHRGGDIVVIGPGSPQDGGKTDVLSRQIFYGQADLQLAFGLRKVQRTVDVHFVGHVPIQVPGAGQPQGLILPPPLLRGGGQVAAHGHPSSAQWAS